MDNKHDDVTGDLAGADRWVAQLAAHLMLSGREHYLEAAVRAAHGHLGMTPDAKRSARITLVITEAADRAFEKLMRDWAARRAVYGE